MIKQAVCRNCGRNFPRYDAPRPGGLMSKVRSFNTVNCSKKCSREWVGKLNNKNGKDLIKTLYSG